MQMVNARFPVASGYGFEMVDAPEALSLTKTPINRKFTPNQKSIGFFANFRRFRLNTNTRDLSSAVSQAD
jgi:hypothetical protein